MHTTVQPTASQYHRQSLERYARRMRDEVQSLGRSQKSVAIDLDMDPGQLSETLAGHRSLGVHWLERWDREIGHGLLDYILAQREDGASIPGGALSTMLALLVKQHGASVSSLLAALEDGILTQQEAAAAMPDLLRLEHTLHELVRRVEQVAA